MKLGKRNFLPKYAIAPLCAIVLAHALVWIGTKLIMGDVPSHYVALDIDALIPLREEWVVVYVLTFPFWLMGLVLIGRQDEPRCYRMAAGAIIAELICCAFFVFYPTIVERPVLCVDDPFSWALSIIYTTDTPTNCLPSMHCLFAYLVFRQSLGAPRAPTSLRVFSGVFAFLVCLSTLFVKQHVVLDVIFGIFFGEISYLLGQKLPAWKLFIKINKKLLQNAP